MRGAETPGAFPQAGGVAFLKGVITGFCPSGEETAMRARQETRLTT
jgi:hypothetical protein